MRQTAIRWDWASRAAAWDADQVSQANSPAVLHPFTTIRPGQAQGLPDEYLQELEEFRAEVQAIGRGHVRLARGLSHLAAKNAARILSSDKSLSPRDIASLASTSASLANSGYALWGQSLGVERLMVEVRRSLEQNIQEAADAEVIES